MKRFALWQWVFILAIIFTTIFSVVRNTHTKATQSTKENAVDLFGKTKNVIVIHCGDKRYVKQFTKFLEEVLGLPEGSYFLISMLGGASPLAHPKEMPVQYNSLREQMLLCDEVCPIDDVFLFTHWHCKYCIKKLGKASWDDREMGHLDDATNKSKEILPRARASGYYAKPVNNDKLSFKLAVSKK